MERTEKEMESEPVGTECVADTSLEKKLKEGLGLRGGSSSTRVMGAFLFASGRNRQMVQAREAGRPEGVQGVGSRGSVAE